MRDLDKISSTVVQAAGKAVSAADKAIEKGKAIMETAALMRRREKAQQQLGALVYSLRKRGEENTLLINRYVESIDRIEQKIKELGGVMPDNSKDGECPHCGQKTVKNAVFCRACGEKLQ